MRLYFFSPSIVSLANGLIPNYLKLAVSMVAFSRRSRYQYQWRYPILRFPMPGDHRFPEGKVRNEVSFMQFITEISQAISIPVLLITR